MVIHFVEHIFGSLCVLEMYEILIDTKFEEHKGDRGKTSTISLNGTNIWLGIQHWC